MRNRAKIDGIKILLVGDAPVAHTVHLAMRFRVNPRAVWKVFCKGISGV